MLGALDPHGVQVHVELGSEITVENRVDVFEMVASCVLVERIGLWVRSVEASTATSHGEGCGGLCTGEDGRVTLGASHQLCHQGRTLFHLVTYSLFDNIDYN